MLKNISDWITRKSINIKEEASMWEEWQKNQSVEHFEKSEIYNTYLSYRPNFKIPEYSAIYNANVKYYKYCFGDFTVFLYLPSRGLASSTNIIEYIILLLDL